jgi:hypothetical protein
MNEFFKNLKQEALTTKLSQNEKQYLRMSLYDAMKKPPATVQEVRVVRAVRSSYFWFSPRFAMPVAVLLVIGLGTGTAFAAQGSLPGGILYPVKIHVNEAVEVALANTPEEKAKTEESIADRRVVEAQTLDAQDRLDATTMQELEDNFDEHASRARAFAFGGKNLVATTSVRTMSVRRQVEEGTNAPHVMTARMAASTTLEATSSEADIPDDSIQNAGDDLSASLQKQKNILNALKLRVGKHGREGDNNTDHGGDNGN